MEEITTTSPYTQHRWRAWVVNTQTSRQHGSHWFTVVVGTQTQLLQSITEHRTSASSSRPPGTADQLLQSTGPADDLDLLCPQCGLVLLKLLRERDLHDLEKGSDWSSSVHTSATGESVESLGEGRVDRKAPVSWFTHGRRIMLGVYHKSSEGGQARI